MPFSDMTACTMQLYHTCMPGSFIQICVLVKAYGQLQIHNDAYRWDGAPTGLYNLSATILDAILNKSNAA